MYTHQDLKRPVKRLEFSKLLNTVSSNPTFKVGQNFVLYCPRCFNHSVKQMFISQAPFILTQALIFDFCETRIRLRIEWAAIYFLALQTFHVHCIIRDSTSACYNII